MNGLTTKLGNLISVLERLLLSSLPDRIARRIQEAIRRLRIIITAIPAEIDEELEELLKELILAMDAVIAALDRYIAALRNGTPQQQADALAELEGCLDQLEAAIAAIERKLRLVPRPRMK